MYEAGLCTVRAAVGLAGGNGAERPAGFGRRRSTSNNNNNGILLSIRTGAPDSPDGMSDT
eukprot:scaffold1610_cov257-Pinguiococcus_pyrenoidosus.AAC.42